MPGAWFVDLLIWSNDNDLRFGGQAPNWLIPVVSCAVFATLVLRRRYPMSVLGVQVLWAGGAGAVMMFYTPFMGALVALHAVAVRRGLMWSVSGLFLTFVALGVPSSLSAIDRMELLLQMLMIVMIGSVAWWLGYILRRSDLRAARMEAEHIATEQALRAERLRIARELHDIVSHAVNVMVIQAAGARAVFPAKQAEVAGALDIIHNVGVQSMDELRRLLCLLRSAAGDEVASASSVCPGTEEIPALIETIRATGLAVSYAVEGTPVRVDSSVGLTAYRLVQEGLTNVMKHAGEGAAAEVRLVWNGGHLAVTIEDRAPAAPHRKAGRGLSTGHGLLGLRERVTIVGGTLQACPLSTGFLVHALLPVARQSPTAADEAATAAADSTSA
ncbi:histidine kinase [Actinoplanes sp. NEAU-A12]|uniref:histidine kinase n=1 Tax=Actinoplanes sandaracinus TaxID=3045177 RepID=A0ABT6WKY2_9ACTN|nr:histidine kinase [Actinoplanes sandaracinus]MDI6100392.1 histidine kinase [Actinoplanes sandaracinus]